MNLISGVLKEDYSDYVLYFVESLCCTGFAINNKVCWCADESS